MKLLFLTLIIANLSFAQKYIVFENNKKNKALFDYNDPNSLVSMLVQNREKIANRSMEVDIDSIVDPIKMSTGDRISNTVSNEGSFHPVESMASFFEDGPKWEIMGSDGSNIMLYRDSISEPFDHWFNRLPIDNPLEWEYSNKLELENQYYKATAESPFILLKGSYQFYDVTQIDLIIIDSTNIYFARNSPYENKHFICLKLKLLELNNLERTDYISEKLTETITDKLKEYQIKKMELDTLKMPRFNIQEYKRGAKNYKEALFNSYDENQFKFYKEKSIKKIFSGDVETIYNYNSDFVPIILTRISLNETFEEWYNRLTTVGDSLPIEYSDYRELTLFDKAKLKEQYEKTGEGQPIYQPDFEAIYWVDYPNPAVYLKRSFWKDSLGKFKTNFTQLLFVERLNNKKGYEQKPQVLMSFGRGDYSVSQEILDLLKSELAPFNLNKEFAWQKIISNRKGNKISNEELKKLIHCYDINENGIEY